MWLKPQKAANGKSWHFYVKRCFDAKIRPKIILKLFIFRHFSWLHLAIRKIQIIPRRDSIDWVHRCIWSWSKITKYKRLSFLSIPLARVSNSGLRESRELLNTRFINDIPRISIWHPATTPQLNRRNHNNIGRIAERPSRLTSLPGLYLFLT